MVEAHPIQFFEYLLALKSLTTPVARSLQDYKDKIWWQSDLPLAEGCYIFDASSDEDIWLEVHKQVLSPAPTPPTELTDWIVDKGNDPENSPTVREEIRIKRSRFQWFGLKESNKDQVVGEEETIIKFDADATRVEIWETWLADEWKPWAKENLPKARIQKLYGELFSLYQRLQREADIVEFVWGHGLLVWELAGHRVSRPLLTTRMELIFDTQSGVFKIAPCETGTVLEFDMLSGLELPNPEHLIKMERFINSEGIDPWDKSITHKFLKEIAETLSPDSRVYLDKIRSGKNILCSEHPAIYDVPVIFLRSRSGRQWHMELNSIIESIRQGAQVPAPLECLTKSDVLKISEETNEEWHAVGEELLFPLPSNADQKEISNRLSKNIGVVVQGPPGTGKSHTIVNLIAHLLAHGKRVLVTSQTERALRVLGEMIRKKLPEIAPLCVSVLGGDARSVSELEDSVSKISEGLDLIDSSKQEELIVQLKTQLDDTRNKIVSIRIQLTKNYEAESSRDVYPLGGKNYLPIELAKWLSDNQELLGWIPDQVDDTIDPPINEEQMVHLFSLLQLISQEEEIQLSQHRPSLDIIPSGTALHAVIATLENYHTTQCARDNKVQGWKVNTDEKTKVSEALKITEEAYKTLQLLRDEWLVKALEDVLRGGQRRSYWEEVLAGLKERIAYLRKLAMDLAEYEITTPEIADLGTFKDDLHALKLEFMQNGKLGSVFRYVSGRKHVYAFEACKINGSALKSLDDLNIIIKHVEQIDAKKKAVLKWNNSVRFVNGPILFEDNLRMLETLESYLENIEVAFAWKNNHLPHLNSVVEVLTPHGIVEWTNVSWLEGFRSGIIAHLENLEYVELQKKHAEFVAFLENGSLNVEPHQSWRKLLDAYRTRDFEKWDFVREELTKLANLEKSGQNLQCMRQKVSRHAPRWMTEIEKQARIANFSQPPQDWEAAWNWKRADTWLRKHFASITIEELYNQLSEARAEEARLIQQIVSANTWLEQVRRTSDSQRRSLRSWVQTIRRIGKAKGKYAAKHQADAKKEMAVCRTAVPVWIMPINRVIESLKPAEEPFDVIIVDEASQCDVFAWSVLHRAKKVVVVGDDRQISPEGVGKDQTEVYKLIDRHLIGVPQKERFTLQDSLYDMALRVFPGQQLMLKEHFRCIPEIIQFSNELFYGGAIEPLRIPQSKDRLNPPIVPIRVLDGYRDEGNTDVNEPEACALANKVAELCSMKEYTGKTFGVISLQGKEQAYLIEQKLRELVGESEIMNRNLLCGDAYSFQGDERDVMFLSMIAAPNVKNGVLNKRSDEQRFNVAISRARDQLWLFHSIDLDKLNPSCMRHRLLQYCLDPKRNQREMEKAEELFTKYGSSQFHKDVYKMIVSRGYRAIPEYKVGTHPYRIDIVIEGHQTRLAVECDGDAWQGLDRWEADLERQTILERVGWKFWRVRGSTFYRHREKALVPLWELLQEMGIDEEPRNQSSQLTWKI
jgi:very-short-patch-repair endonuclease